MVCWFYPLLSICAPFYGYLKIFTKLHGKERSQNKDLRSHLGIDLRISCTEGCALTNRAIPFLCYSLLLLSGRSLLVFFCRPLCPRSLGSMLRSRGKGRTKLKWSEPRGTQGALRWQIFAVSPRFLPSLPPTIERGLRPKKRGLPTIPVINLLMPFIELVFKTGPKELCSHVLTFFFLSESWWTLL